VTGVSPHNPLQVGVRFLAADAGPFRLALPLNAVRQILDLGGAQATAPTDPRALGVEPVSLARLLGAAPNDTRQGLLLLDGLSGPVLMSACSLFGVFDTNVPVALPETVVCRWPGLVAGIVREPDGGVRLALDAGFLMGLIESAQVEQASADPSRSPAQVQSS
jgi:hypothetical protein